jgi:hypothetical protein
MGMPINSFSIMRTICQGGDTYMVKAVKELLDEFKLFAIIIHDPNLHRDLDRHIARQFDHLDYITGKDLLFFSLVEAPGSWKHHASDRSYYKNFSHQMFVKSNKPELKSSLDGESSYSLAITLGIPIEDLPCIVLTPDLKSRNYVWYKTDEQHIDVQLSTMGRIANRDDKDLLKTNFDTLIQEYSDELNICDGVGNVSNEEMIAKKLMDFLSIVFAQDKKLHHWEKYGAENVAKKTLHNLYNQFSSGTYVDNKKFEEDCLKFASYYKIFNSMHLRHQREFESIKNLLEAESFYLLNLGLSVSNFIANSQIGKSAELEEYKFAPSLICLTTAFETEINRSITSWIRSNLGIQMPERYYIGDRRRPVYTNVTNKEINYNAVISGGNLWKPPGLGESLMVFKQMKSNFDYSDGLKNSDFIHRWERINNIRNPVAHQGRGSLSSYNEVVEYWNYFKDQNVLLDLFNLKNILRGNSN